MGGAWYAWCQLVVASLYGLFLTQGLVRVTFVPRFRLVFQVNLSLKT